ncbi:DUF4262 domain-containing protein [Streptomyces sp. NPDC047726]|uniref:DUF4262 domain-containing protein n=1 Tax=unclassified Streptomyces TaxID=2593676 RepID=UPI0033E7DD98
MPTDDITSNIPPETGRHSHDVLWVFDPDGKAPTFAYTVGLGARFGRSYELALTGLPAEMACAVLNNAAESLVTGDASPADGMVLDDVLIGYTARLRPVGDASALTGIRAEFGGDVPVWQVLWPDRRGAFPEEPGYDGRLAPQPLM